MKVDALPFKHFVVAFSVAWGLVFVAFIAGLCGPASEVSTSSFAYQCPNNTHTWGPECKGIQPGLGEKVVVEVPGLRSTNRFWALNARPYNKNLKKNSNANTFAKMKVNIVVSVLQRSSIHGEWEYEVKDEKRTVSVVCPTSVKGAGDRPCDMFTLIDEEYVDHRFHKVEAVLTAEKDKDGKLDLGDLQLVVNFGTAEYSNLEMGLNIFFLLTSLAALVVFLYGIRAYIFHGWSYEQIWTVGILLSAIFYNNPFFALEYLVPGWFFQFFDAVVKDLFLALLIIFWLLCIEEFRDGDDFDANSKKHAPKVFVAAAYFVFAVITFTWASVADRRNPVLSSPFEIPAVVVLYVITVLILFGAIVWMVVMAVMAVPKIAHSPLMFTRFLFLAIPSFVLALVVLIGAFCGNYGTGNTNSFQLVFFSTLYNVYTWLLVFGFWPAPGRYDLGNAKIIEEDNEESRPIIDDTDDHTAFPPTTTTTDSAEPAQVMA